MRRSTLRLLALHLIGNASLLLLGYYWLGTSESDGLHLLWSFTVCLLVISGVLWLHGSSLVFFRQERRSLGDAFRLSLKHLPSLLALAIVGATVYAGLHWVAQAFDHTAFLIASFVTMKIRKPLAPEKVLGAYHLLLWLLRWLVLPALLFVAMRNVAEGGWNGFRWRRSSMARFAVRSLITCALLLLALAVPLKLLSWVPSFSQFEMQMASLVTRMGVAYLLFVLSLLAIEFMTASGRPVRTQPSTVPSP